MTLRFDDVAIRVIMSVLKSLQTSNLPTADRRRKTLLAISVQYVDIS